MVHIELESAAARAHDKSISKKEQEIAHEAVQTFLDALAMLTYAEGGVCVLTPISRMMTDLLIDISRAAARGAARGAVRAAPRSSARLFLIKVGFFPIFLLWAFCQHGVSICQQMGLFFMARSEIVPHGTFFCPLLSTLFFHFFPFFEFTFDCSTWNICAAPLRLSFSLTRFLPFLPPAFYLQKEKALSRV